MKVFLYTDGVTEAFNSNEEDFKEERLLQSLKINSVSSAEKIVANVFESVKNFTNGVEQSDDITCLALKYLKR